MFHGVPGDGQALPDHFPPSPTPRGFGESAGAKEIHIKTEPRVGYFYCIVICTGLEFESNRQKMFDLPVLLTDKLNYTCTPTNAAEGWERKRSTVDSFLESNFFQPFVKAVMIPRHMQTMTSTIAETAVSFYKKSLSRAQCKAQSLKRYWSLTFSHPHE